MPRPDLTLVAGGRTTGSFRRVPSAGDLPGLYRLRRLIEPELSAQACLMIPFARLNWLRAHVPFTASHTDHVLAAHRAFHLALIQPAATRWDLRVLRPLWAEADGLARQVLGPDGRSTSDLIGSGCCCVGLIEAYRTRDPDTVRAATVGYLDSVEHLARELSRAVG